MKKNQIIINIINSKLYQVFKKVMFIIKIIYKESYKQKIRIGKNKLNRNWMTIKKRIKTINFLK